MLRACDRLLHITQQMIIVIVVIVLSNSTLSDKRISSDTDDAFGLRPGEGSSRTVSKDMRLSDNVKLVNTMTRMTIFIRCVMWNQIATT